MCDKKSKYSAKVWEWEIDMFHPFKQHSTSWALRCVPQTLDRFHYFLHLLNSLYTGWRIINVIHFQEKLIRPDVQGKQKKDKSKMRQEERDMESIVFSSNFHRITCVYFL